MGCSGTRLIDERVLYTASVTSKPLRGGPGWGVWGARSGAAAARDLERETGDGNHVTENMRHTMENFISYI